MWILEKCDSRSCFAKRSIRVDEVYYLLCGKWTIGRVSSAVWAGRIHSVASSIVASVITVSRQHVAIDVSDSYDPKDPHSVMTLTISDMHTKHGTKWNGECGYESYV